MNNLTYGEKKKSKVTTNLEFSILHNYPTKVKEK